MQDLFGKIYNSKDELELQQVIEKYPEIFSDENWKPLGGNYSNYGVVKNQQANPIAALIEKLTNAIDAILTKKCHESGIDPKDSSAPQSMDEAVNRFYPDNYNWDRPTFRNHQAEEIQVIADGRGPFPQRNGYATSVVIYDNGEGQHPENFESTFLSLLRGNKNDIHFVQGKYNMGGSGAIVFCGKKRYQLIASKRYTNDGLFGFTLIREHPKRESDHAKETWYEYLTIDGKIPLFEIGELDLGLENRKFKTGTIIKMYSYQFPKGYYGFAQDLHQSINEFLYRPALPILTKDTKERYPNQNVLSNSLFGLERRLKLEEEDYIDDKFSQSFDHEVIGPMKVSCYVFKTKIKDQSLKDTIKTLEQRYFKNNMSVLFSLNGQVHGGYSYEFITRALKLNVLKKHLLIHVDCTDMKYDFRKELFMASRDRLKDGDETQMLRSFLAENLTKDGRLAEIEKYRKQAVDVDTASNTSQLLKNFTKNMPFDSELVKLLNQTFKLDLKSNQPQKGDKAKKPKDKTEDVPFKPERFPTKFKLKAKNDGETEVAKIPLGGDRTIRFETDVENDYFDRIEEPGEMQISILNLKPNESEGGDQAGTPKELTDLFNVSKSSPHEGTIKITLNPKQTMQVGDTVQMKVTLTAPGEDFEEIFWVKVVDKEKPKEPKPKPEQDEEPMGLPPLVFAYQDKEGKGDQAVSWEDVENATSLDMDIKTVMVPEAEGDNLTRIFVNMESSVLMSFKSKYKHPNAEQIELSNRKYYTSVYFHTLFLYTITKNRGYEIRQKQEDREEFEPVDVGSYLKDVFDNYYSSFLLNFGGMEEMMTGIGD